MCPPRSISVLIPTYRGIEFLGRLLDALAGQECDLEWDLSVVDSSSDDGTWELLERRRADFPVPFRLNRIHPLEFDHGDTRNWLAARSGGDLLVFLTQDAIPTRSDWLAGLARNFEDSAVAAVTCRNVVRPGAGVATQLFFRDDPCYSEVRRETRLPEPEVYAAMEPEERRRMYVFNDVASAIRRELWERHPFPRTNFGEDMLMARALLEAGYTVVFDPEAAVEHSHEYDEREHYSRGWIDGRFNAEWLDRVCIASPEDQARVEGELAQSDRAWIETLGLEPGAETRLGQQAEAQRHASIQGLYDGGLSTRRRARTQLLESGQLSILYVVHGFPPDTWAGTEVYTLYLAQAMQARGHRVTVLTRVPADARELPDFHVEQAEFEGLRVLRMTHRLAHANVRESYHQPRAEQAFREVLTELQPQLVHFQHLIHLSAGLVRLARDSGLPTVVTCHDYWALCARVQLVRPDGQLCEKNMGSGCYACVRETGLRWVDALARLDRGLGGALMMASAEEMARAPWASRSLSERAQVYLGLRQREDFVLDAYAAADLCISPSRFLRETLLASGRFEAHRFLFSDNGMRTDHLYASQKRPDAAGRLRFGFIGTLIWYKGGELLMRAMQLLKESRAVLRVHGSFDPKEDRHHAHLAELARGAEVEFCGRFDNAQLAEVLAEIDVLIVPSQWWENSPVTIHEAFLTRTPVIATGIGGMAEYVEHEGNGLLFDLGDARDLARQMQRLIDDPRLLEHLSRGALPVKTIEDNAAELEFRYRSLVSMERVSAADRASSLDYRGAHTASREGPSVVQGRELLLLRPGGAAEYDLEPLSIGAHEEGVRVSLELEVRVLAAEEDVALGGRVLADGLEVGRIPAFVSRGRTVLETFRFEWTARRRQHRLRIESREAAGGPPLHLRVERLRLRLASLATPSPDDSSSGGEAPTEPALSR